MLDLSEDAVRGMIKRREITFHKLGRRVRLRYADLQAALVRYPSVRDVAGFQNDLDLSLAGS